VPLATEAPAAGLWLMTFPAAIVSLACMVTSPTSNSAATSASSAAVWFIPTTAGTVICAGGQPTSAKHTNTSKTHFDCVRNMEGYSVPDVPT
jgi:hypothetical protein